MDNIDTLVLVLANHFWEHGTWAEEQDCWEVVTKGLRQPPEGVKAFYQWAEQIQNNNPPHWGRSYNEGSRS